MQKKKNSAETSTHTHTEKHPHAHSQARTCPVSRKALPPCTRRRCAYSGEAAPSQQTSSSWRLLPSVIRTNFGFDVTCIASGCVENYIRQLRLSSVSFNQQLTVECLFLFFYSTSFFSFLCHMWYAVLLRQTFSLCIAIVACVAVWARQEGTFQEEGESSSCYIVLHRSPEMQTVVFLYLKCCMYSDLLFVGFCMRYVSPSRNLGILPHFF